MGSPGPASARRRNGLGDNATLTGGTNLAPVRSSTTIDKQGNIDVPKQQELPNYDEMWTLMRNGLMPYGPNKYTPLGELGYVKDRHGQWQAADGQTLSLNEVMGITDAARNNNNLWAAAGAPGFLYGYQAPMNPTAMELPGLQIDARLARARGNIDIGYGRLPTLSDFGGDKKRMAAVQGTNLFGKALTNRERIESTVERNAGLARDASSAMNIADAEQNARAASFRAASSGTTGSSTDLSQRRGVLGSYLTGRRNVATTALATRNAANNALEQQRLATIGSLDKNAPNDYSGHVANLALVDQLGQAAKNVVPNAIGQGIGDLGNILANGILYQNQGMQGLKAFSLPSLSGGSGKTSGGLSMTGMGARKGTY